MKISICAFVLFLSLAYACKHEHAKPSPMLEKAFSIQKDGIKELKQIETIISNLPVDQKEKYISKKSLWQSSMLEIEGMEHDHSQCSGDHSKKRFTISDEDMLAAQTEWRDSILVLKNLILASNGE